MLTTVADQLQPQLRGRMATLVAMSTLQARLEAALKNTKPPKERADLARACEISRQAVDKWFDTEAKNLKMEHLFAVADECAVEARWLATNSGPMKRTGKADSMPSDIPQRRIDLIRMYGRLPEDIRQPIRALIETLAFVHHPNKGELAKRVGKPETVHNE
jgi:hypothetical protein